MTPLKPFIRRLILAAGTVLFSSSVWASTQTSVDNQTSADTNLRDVIVVGNNWDGSIDIYDPHTYQRIKKLNAVPDKAERLEELTSTIKRRITSTFIKEVIGEGHHQMVDDMFPSNDGRHLFISRPSFADVVALDVNTGEITWRTGRRFTF